MRERIIQLHFLLRGIIKHFDHHKLIGRHESRDAFSFTFNLVLNGQLEFEFALQSRDIAFHIAEHKHQPINPSDHWDVDVHHRSTVVGRGIVNDYWNEQIAVLVGNVQIGGTHKERVYLDHLAISSDINHVRSIERNR